MFRPPRPTGVFLRSVLAALLLVLLLDLIGLNMVIFGAAAGASATHVRKTTVVSSTADATIAVIPVEDLITGETAVQFDQFLTAASEDSNVKAVVLAIDTPGGEASAADTMYHRLMEFKNEKKIPVVVTMGGLATSGGYYVACGADYIFAEPTTMTANIGVIFPRFNVSELMQKYGVKETTIVATGCTYKNLGSMFSPEDPKAVAYLQGLVDGTFEQFKKVVLAGRHNLPADTSDIFNGRVYMASDALKLGLIDQIGYAEDAYAYAKKAANLTDAKVERYLPPSALQRALDSDSLSNITGGQARSSQSEITINGVNVDAGRLLDLVAPRPMYLWMGN